MTGDDQPLPGIRCFQTMFLVLLHSSGSPPSTWPCPVGPRNSGQSAAADSPPNNNSNPTQTERIIVSPRRVSFHPRSIHSDHSIVLAVQWAAGAFFTFG